MPVRFAQGLFSWWRCPYRRRFTAVTSAVAVMPRFRTTWSPEAEAPKRSMEIEVST
jgi:hypothetical protein